ncbi:outer membrane protein assembly factor BamE [Shimia sp.]|uniref:outer membrane protein assembly factor BamE n=1 Tax=Shimia sp. TaxID=1954381 RepID=UPI003BA8694D
MNTRKTMIKVTVMGALILSLASCATRYRNHGYVPSDEELASITLGVDTRDSIAETFGPPSASGVLNDSGYLYVRSRVKHFGPRRPEVVDRQIVAIGFDGNGIARNIEQYALEDGQVVPLSRRITDNNIQSGGLLRQLGRNLGNFSPIGTPAPGSGDF